MTEESAKLKKRKTRRARRSTRAKVARLAGNPAAEEQPASSSAGEVPIAFSLESPDFANTLIQTADVLVIPMDVDGNIQSVNEAVERVTGYSNSELRGKNWLEVTELFAPRRRYPELWEQLGRLNWKSVPLSLEEPIVTKTGDERYVSWRIHSVRREGRIVGAVSFGIDVTDHRRVEEELRKARDYAENLVRTANVMIVHLDTEGRIEVVNRATEEISGYTQGELEGKNWFETLVPRERYPEVWRAFERLTAGGIPEAFENPILTRNGEERIISWRNNYVEENGVVAGTISFGLDVTDQKRAEKALLESETRFRSLVQNASDIITVLDTDGNTRYVSPSVEATLGYKPEELVGTKPFEYMHPDDIQRALGELAEAISRPMETRRIEVRLRHKDGSWRSIEAIGTNLIDDPLVNGIVLNSRDVTEHKQAAEALRQSEERFRDLFEKANDMVYTRDLAGNLTAVNQMAERVTGYTRKELIGRNIAELMSAENVHRSMMTLENAPDADEDDLTDVVEFIRKDGRRVPVEVRARLIFEDGQPVAVQGIARDISERLKAQEELAASEERFRELFENANDLLYIHDLDGRFLAVNKKAQEITGYSEEEALSKNLSDLLPPADLAYAGQMLARGATTYELSVIASDGRLIPLEVSTRIVTKDGRPYAIQGIARDITDRRQAEAAQRERSRLDALSAAIGDAFGELPGLEALTPSCEAILQKMELAVVQIWVYDRNSREMRLRAGAGLKGRGGPKRSQALSVFPNELDGRPSDFVNNQAESDPSVIALAPRGVKGICAYATFPLIVESEVSGVLAVLSRAPIDDGAAQTLSRVSDVLATRIARRAAEEELERTQKRFGALIENTSDIIAVVSAGGDIRYVTPSVERVSGFPPDTIVGRNIVEGMKKKDAARALRTLSEIAARPGGTGSLDWTLRRSDGQIRHIEAVGRNLIDDPSIAGIVINARDITERKEFEEELAHQAFYEPLTGLPNRALFMDRLEHAFAAASRGDELIAVLFMDLDRFKVVNDSLGHSVGDRLLVALSKRLAKIFRPGDTLARFGGDEFTILLERLRGRGDALAVAQRIIEELGTPFDLDGHEMFASASIGIAFAGQGGGNAESLLRDADVALYRAKAEGRARYVVFDEEMNLRAIERLDLENDLRRAIERNEITVHYQPEIELRTGRQTGFEALARWRHGQLGAIPPSEFIPLAEDNGLIFRLGLWILHEACSQAAMWRAAAPGIGYQVSVNLSAVQLQHPEMVSQVRSVLDETGLPPDLLTLEITESVALQELAAITQRLTELKGLGVKLAIDDFGAGYSSLRYLTQLRVDILKIDRTFISGFERDDGKKAIVRALISLGRNLGLTVTAEGVETKGQLRLLKEMGCDRAQGYLFAKPMSRQRALQVVKTSKTVSSTRRAA